MDDNGSVLVIILQCETKPCDKNIKTLAWVFSDPYFIVQICAVDPPHGPSPSKALSQSHFQENHFMRKALEYASEGPYAPNESGTLMPQKWWTQLPCIIVKDSSISNVTPSGIINPQNNHLQTEVGGMKTRIKTALSVATTADLFFLCKWNDACSKYVDIAGAAKINGGSSLKWSLQPTATQAIMYTPTSRDYLKSVLAGNVVPMGDFLNLHIAEGKLKATVFVPNIIDYDTGLATSNEDYAKANECQPMSTATTDTASATTVYVWVAIIIIIMVALAWFLVQTMYPIQP